MDRTNHYINLFHGRTDPNKDMEEMGTPGPIIGPVSISWCYGKIRIHNPEYGNLEMVYLPQTDDMIEIDAVYYGDFEILDRDDPIVLNATANLRDVMTFHDVLCSMPDNKTIYSNQ